MICFGISPRGKYTFYMIYFPVYRCYGIKQSLASWHKQRINRSSESVSDAETRSRVDTEKVEKGEKKQKDHTGSLEKIT